jgi:hypothetical protein
MFKKLGKALSTKSAKYKIRIDVAVVEVTGLPDAIPNCRVILQRGSKLQMTKIIPVQEGRHIQFISNHRAPWFVFHIDSNRPISPNTQHNSLSPYTL